MRQLKDVHDKIIKVIPENEIELIKELKKFIDSLWNLPPEITSSGNVYNPYFNILFRHIPDYFDLKDEDDENWKVKCRNIFADRPLKII
jgi:hypothetical protein